MLRSHLLIAGIAALLVAPAHAQDPADPATPDGMEMPPVEVVMGMEGEVPVCAPADFRLPVDNPVALMLRNEASTTLDFTAPELFEASVVAGRQGGQAWVTQDGALLARVPAGGTVEIAFVIGAAGDYAYGCLVPGRTEKRFEGRIEAIPTPSDG